MDLLWHPFRVPPLLLGGPTGGLRFAATPGYHLASLCDALSEGCQRRTGLVVHGEPPFAFAHGSGP